MMRLLYVALNLAAVGTSLAMAVDVANSTARTVALTNETQAILARLKPADYAPGIPAGAVEYTPAKWTQAISVLNSGGIDRDVIAPAPIAKLPDKRWHQPGGLEGVRGWESRKYRTLPTQAKEWVGNIEVENGIPTGRLKADGTAEHYRQHNRGLLRTYPDGTRFDDVLVNAASGKVFEHRVRVKVNGRWEAKVYHRDEGEFPRGYKPVPVKSCNACHREAGTGGYNVGLVPGSDTVFSDPLPWKVWTAKSPEQE